MHDGSGVFSFHRCVPLARYQSAMISRQNRPVHRAFISGPIASCRHFIRANREERQAEEKHMRDVVRSTFIGIAVAGLALCASAVSAGNAFAQAKPVPAPADAARPADAPIRQIALTEKQIEGVLAAQKDMDALDDKLPDNPNVKPDSKAIAQLDAIAKKSGFASYAEYNNVIDNIGLVLGGFDPATKKYIGVQEVLKRQIAAVQADTKMPAKEKKQALDDINAALQTPPPVIENKGNIDLVAKYYDKLAGALSESEDD
jgi:hypothetical protein